MHLDALAVIRRSAARSLHFKVRRNGITVWFGKNASDDADELGVVPVVAMPARTLVVLHQPYRRECDADLRLRHSPAELGVSANDCNGVTLVIHHWQQCVK
jgi:hypothetical protein